MAQRQRAARRCGSLRSTVDQTKSVEQQEPRRSARDRTRDGRPKTVLLHGSIGIMGLMGLMGIIMIILCNSVFFWFSNFRISIYVYIIYIYVCVSYIYHYIHIYMA